MIRQFSRRRVAALAAVSAAVLLATSACASSASGTAGSNRSGGSHASGCGYAFVFDQPLAGNTAEQTIQRGLKRAASQDNVDVNIVESATLSSFADNLRTVAAKGCYDAIGTSFFETGDILTQVAADFPKQKFFIFGGTAKGPNVAVYSTADEQGTYVAGAMAATLSKTHTVGIIIGTDSPPLKLFSVGYAAGAKSVNPNVKVLQNVVGSFTDAAKTGAIAVTQAGQGADIIYSAAGSNLQVYFLGAQHRYQTVASDLTDYATAKPRHPAVAFIAAEAEDNAAASIIKQYVTHTVSATNERLTLKDGLYSIPYVTDSGTADYTLPADVIAAGKKAYQDVTTGKVTVPTS